MNIDDRIESAKERIDHLTSRSIAEYHLTNEDTTEEFKDYIGRWNGIEFIKRQGNTAYFKTPMSLNEVTAIKIYRT